MHENFKHTYEYPPSRMRLGLRISPLIGNIQVCVLRYVLQLCPSISISLHVYVRELAEGANEHTEDSVYVEENESSQ